MYASWEVGLNQSYEQLLFQLAMLLIVVKLVSVVAMVIKTISRSGEVCQLE